MVNGLNRIYDELEAEAIERARHAAEDLGGWFERATHGAQAPPVTAVNVDTTTITEEPMGFVTDVKNELAAAAHDLAAHAVQFDQNVLPGLAGKLTALENNPVIDSLLNAVHVPPEALAIVVTTIDGLEALYNQPAQAVQAPAGPQVAGQA